MQFYQSYRKHLREPRIIGGGEVSNSKEIIEKLNEYEAQRKETLDWPYHRLLENIIDDVIEIVKEVAE